MYNVISVILYVQVSTPLPNKYSVFASTAPILTFASGFFISSYYLLSLVPLNFIFFIGLKPNSWWMVAARFSKSEPDQNAIFYPHF